MSRSQATLQNVIFRERKQETESEQERGRKGARERKGVCVREKVCVGVCEIESVGMCVRGRERERESVCERKLHRAAYNNMLLRD